MTEIVCDVDRDEDDAGQQSHQGKCCSHRSKEAKEAHNIKTDVVDELKPLHTNELASPRREAV